MAENLHIGFLSSLKSAVTEGIDYGIYLPLLLAQGAVTEAVGLIIRHILPCKNGVDRNGMCLIYRAENRVDGADFAAVILDTLDTLIQGFSGGGCSQQQQDILIPDHQLHIVAENQLASGMVLRSRDIDGLVLIDGTNSGLGQLLCQICPNHLTSIQAYDGVHNAVVRVIGQQSRCRLGFILARLQCGQVNVIIDVGMFSLFPVTQNATGLLTTRSHYYFFLV